MILSIVAEGVISALSRLRVNDKETELACVTALHNISCVDKALAKAIDSELVTALIQLVQSISFGNSYDLRVNQKILEITVTACLNLSNR
jgi:hypothetical protein